MRKLLLLFILSIFISHSYAQWESVASGFSTTGRGISQIVAVNKNIAWATGQVGTSSATTTRDFTRTTDGGATWTAGTVTGPPSTNNWSCLTAINADTAWGVFYKNSGTFFGGGIWRTNDGGTTWAQQTAFGTSSFPDVAYFWDADTGMTLGDPVNGEFEIYTTSDGGATWTQVDTANIPNPLAGETGLTRSIYTWNNIVWCGTTQGRILKSTDHGATWTVLNTVSSGNYVDLLAFADEMNGWAEIFDLSGNFVGLFNTTDGGNTWTDITPTGTFFNFYGLAFVPTTTSVLVASGFDNLSLSFGSAYSLDGGNSWVTIDSFPNTGSGPFHFAVAFANNVTGWSGDENVDNTTGMWNFTGGFVATGIQNPNSDFNFKLYPNPSDGLFYFSFDAPNNEPIHITVTDAMGKIVFNQVYKDKSQTWLRSIDMRNFSKGVYFMKVENGDDQTNHELVIQ